MRLDPPEPQKVDFGSGNHFLLKNALWRPKCSFCAKVHFGARNALSRPHAADACETNAFLMGIHPFWAKKRFWAQKCILAPKCHFFIKNGKSGPEMHFWAPKCKNRERGQKVNDGLSLAVIGSGFPDSGPERIHGRGKQNM